MSVSSKTPERLLSYFEACIRKKASHPEWRMGQTCFNVLYFDGFDPEFADGIRGGPFDPFHRDAAVDDFVAALVEHWFDLDA